MQESLTLESTRATRGGAASARYWPYLRQLEPPLPRPDLLRRIFDEAADVFRPPALPPVPAALREAALPE